MIKVLSILLISTTRIIPQKKIPFNRNFLYFPRVWANSLQKKRLQIRRREINIQRQDKIIERQYFEKVHQEQFFSD